MNPPYPTDSDEVRAIIRFLVASGVPHVITATTNHKQTTSAGYQSNHVKTGTHGKGLAVDFAERWGGGYDTPGLGNIFRVFTHVEGQLSELIYSGAAYSIKNGKRVPRYAIADHHDHVHVAVPLGVFLQPPAQHPAGGYVAHEPYEVQMNVSNVDVTIPTGSDGKGWATVPYNIDHVLGVVPPGLRPEADHRVLIGQIGLAADGASTVVSVSEWAPNTSTVVRLRVAV